jgi:glycosyltransferase involved in cell wall biosynthesis
VQTALVGTTTAIHDLMGTWDDKIDRYIVLTEFARRKFVEGGFEAEALTVKPNFTSDPGVGAGEGSYALFVGRISDEKGPDVAVEAWTEFDLPLSLKMVGEGPLSEQIAEAVADVPDVEYLGRKPHDEVRRLMKEAALLVLPSIWYEGLPMTIVEAFSVGLPVAASNLGAMSTLIDHQETGLHFEPKDPAALAEQVRWAGDHPEGVRQMRDAARRTYEERYTPERNYEMLRGLYREVIAETN